MSASPAVVRRFTPGRRKAKIAALAASLFLAGLGLWELSWPLTRLLKGTSTEAEVVAVVERRPGQVERRLGEGENAGDPTRAVVYVCEVSYVDWAGVARRSMLNVATQVAPAYPVGSRLRIAYTRSGAEPALVIFDWRTWALGGFLSMTGLCFAVVSGSLLLAARRPIPLSADSDLP